MSAKSSSSPLKVNDLPTPSLESWKYTNLPRALAANLALAEKPQEILIHKTRGQICEQPEDILFTGVDNQHQQPVLNIVLEEGAQLTVIEHHNSSGSAGTYWKNMLTEIKLAKGAQLNHIRIQDEARDAVQTNMVSLEAAQDSVYNGFTLNVGGKLTRHEIHAKLQGSNAEVSFNGLNLLSGKQHGDTTIVVEHQAPHGRSNQFYRSILDEQARGVFQGKVYVHKEAQKTDAYQLSNAMLLSETAEMDIKPELEIYADDVKCSHGSTCGQLDEEPLFYLRQRGLSEGEARLLLVRAFVDEIVDKVDNDSIRTEIQERAGAWLQTALHR